MAPSAGTAASGKSAGDAIVIDSDSDDKPARPPPPRKNKHKARAEMAAALRPPSNKASSVEISFTSDDNLDLSQEADIEKLFKNAEARSSQKRRDSELSRRRSNGHESSRSPKKGQQDTPSRGPKQSDQRSRKRPPHSGDHGEADARAPKRPKQNGSTNGTPFVRDEGPSQAGPSQPRRQRPDVFKEDNELGSWSRPERLDTAPKGTKTSGAHRNGTTPSTQTPSKPSAFKESAWEHPEPLQSRSQRPTPTPTRPAHSAAPPPAASSPPSDEVQPVRKTVARKSAGRHQAPRRVVPVPVATKPNGAVAGPGPSTIAASQRTAPSWKVAGKEPSPPSASRDATPKPTPSKQATPSVATPKRTTNETQSTAQLSTPKQATASARSPSSAASFSKSPLFGDSPIDDSDPAESAEAQTTEFVRSLDGELAPPDELDEVAIPDLADWPDLRDDTLRVQTPSPPAETIEPEPEVMQPREIIPPDSVTRDSGASEGEIDFDALFDSSDDVGSELPAQQSSQAGDVAMTAEEDAEEDRSVMMELLEALEDPSSPQEDEVYGTPPQDRPPTPPERTTVHVSQEEWEVVLNHKGKEREVDLEEVFLEKAAEILPVHPASAEHASTPLELATDEEPPPDRLGVACRAPAKSSQAFLNRWDKAEGKPSYNPQLHCAIFEAYMGMATANDELLANEIKVDPESGPPPPFEFYYTNEMVYHKDVPEPELGAGCGCEGPCDPDNMECLCVRRQMKYFYDVGLQGFNYTNNGLLRHFDCPVWECGPNCGCPPECVNRVIQRGRSPTMKLILTKTDDRGWGVRTSSPIQQGEFVGIYSGEIIADHESERRGVLYDRTGRTYLFDLDGYQVTHPPPGLEEVDPRAAKLAQIVKERASREEELGNSKYSNYSVDAYHYGFTRFFNHSCNPNLRIAQAYVKDFHPERPLLAVFAWRNIRAGEELTISYKGKSDDPLPQDNGRRIVNKKKSAAVHISPETRSGRDSACLCGEPNCNGSMFTWD